MVFLQLTQQELVILRETFLFYHMPRGDFFQFSRQSSHPFVRRSFMLGESVSFPDEEEHVLGIIVSGGLRTKHRERRRRRSFGKGFVFGVMDLFSNARTAWPDLAAESPCLMLFITASQVRKLFADYPMIMMNYINFLTGQLKKLHWENTMASLATAEERVTQYLAYHMVREEERCEVRMSCSMVTLAEQLHMSRASLYRILGVLQEKGLIRQEGKLILILRPEQFHSLLP